MHWLLVRLFGKKWNLPKDSLVRRVSFRTELSDTIPAGNKPKMAAPTTFSVGDYGKIKINSQPPDQEHPRKAELRELAKTLGVRDPVCPYCQIPLAKLPQRKTKCKACGGQIYSRKEPLIGEKRLFKEDELELFDELHELSLGTWNWWNDRREKILAAKSQGNPPIFNGVNRAGFAGG